MAGHNGRTDESESFSFCAASMLVGHRAPLTRGAVCFRFATWEQNKAQEKGHRVDVLLLSGLLSGLWKKTPPEWTGLKNALKMHQKVTSCRRFSVGGDPK